MAIKTPCQLTPLRIFMGVQMIGWAVLTWYNNPWHLVDSAGGSLIWALTLLVAGAWVLSTALVDLYCLTQWPGVWQEKQRNFYRSLNTATVAGYFFSGAAWGGIGSHAMKDGALQDVDFICPLYMVFLLFLAFKDASKKRKGAVYRHEKARSASSFAPVVHPVHGVHPKRPSR